MSDALARRRQAIRETGTEPDCKACENARIHGWWGSTIPRGTTHCQDCHTTFPGSQRWGHCARCHQTFSGVVSFNLHQRHTDDGEYTDGCLCSVVFGLEGTPIQADLPSQWVVSAAKVLHRRSAPWGEYWGGEAPDFSAVAS